MRNIVLTLFLWFCLPNLVYALSDTTQFVNFNIENGLPSNNVYSTLQDRDGYMWILTDNGVLKYNGYTFKNFNTSTGLPSSDVWYLKEDSYGRMWVYTYAYEVGYIKDDKFYKIDIGNKHSLCKIAGVFEYIGYTFILVTFSRGLGGQEIYIVDKDDKIVYVQKNLREQCLALGAKIFTVYQYLNHFVYEWTPYGLKRTQACHFKPFYGFAFSAITRNMNSLYLDHGSDKFSLWTLPNCTHRQTSITEYGGEKAEKIYLSYVAGDSFCLITDKAVYTIDNNFKPVSRFKYQNILPNTQASFFYKSIDRSIWLSTAKKGFVQIFPHSNEFTNLHVDSQLTESQYIGTINGNKSMWWYNSFSQTIKQIDINSGKVTSRKFPENVHRVSEGLDGQIYLFGRSRIMRLDTVSGSTRDFVTSPKLSLMEKFFTQDDRRYLVENDSDLVITNDGKTIVFSGFTDLHEYKPNVFWGISYEGIHFIEINSDTSFTGTLDKTKYTNLYFDSVGKKYIVYNNSTVLLLDPESKKTTKLDIGSLQQVGIKSILSVHIDFFRNVLVQTESDIYAFSLINGSYGKITTEVNLSNTKVRMSGNTVLIAGKFGLAYATSSGPFSFSEFKIIPNIRIKYYSRVYDLVYENEASVAVLNTDKGIYSYKIDNSRDTRDWKSGDRQRLVLTTPFQKMIGKDSLIRVPAGTEKITLDYINYYGNGSVSYAYTIDGAGKRELTNSGEIILSNLEPGKVHKIQCDIKDDLWEYRNHTFFIEKEPYWYQTFRWNVIFWTGGIVIFLVFIVLTALITRRYVANVNLKKRAMIDLELRAIYSQINPHFIFNTLSSSQYFISKRNFEEAYLNINKFSRLLRAYLKSSRNKYVTLAEEIGMLKDYIELQKARFEEKLDYTIEVENKIPANDVLLPSLLLQPLVENAINHGLFHKQGGGMLTLRFYQGSTSNEMICEIEDDGVGRARSKQIYEESTVTRESYGTTLTEELIKLYGKYESMKINIIYIDKQLPETGTIVQLRINNLKYVDL